MKAPFAYYGGKSRLACVIASLMPTHAEYIEPFFGSGAVLFAKTPATHEIINDLDGAVVAFFHQLRDNLDELTRVCALTPHARDEFDQADLDDEDLDELELARRFWVRVNQSFAKTAGRQATLRLHDAQLRSSLTRRDVDATFRQVTAANTAALEARRAWEDARDALVAAALEEEG